MLDLKQQELLNQLLSSLTRDQMVWMSGYIAGKSGLEQTGQTSVSQASVEKPSIDIYYATETGNSKGLSLQLMKSLKQAGYKAKNTAVNRLKPESIKRDGVAIFLVSTHGEGDPPESAVAFFEAVKALPDQTLSGLSYAMLGLGDSSYEIFCGAATQLDEQLKRLGGTAFSDITLLDVDYANHTKSWIASIVSQLDATYNVVSSTTITAQLDDEATVRTGKGYTRLAPVKGTVKEIINLNDRDSAKETYHIEIEYDTSAVIYTPGDAVGIILPKDENGQEVTPRLYSIASSPSYHEGEIHLTVALATHVNENGSTGFGIASRYLSECREEDEIEFYVSQNQIFNLPKDDQDAIMIGPGTGIAPFRSFVYERLERGHNGRNWVFFGDQHAHCDFLYQAEWQEHLATEAINRIDLAFSRDQEQKVYVQHRILEHADTLISWIDNGAAIYVCGSKDPMSRDVERTLIDILKDKKTLTEEQAQDFLAELEEQQRYVKDVY